MEYIIAVVITIGFLIIYIVTKRSPREEFTTLLTDEKYKKKCIEDAKAVGVPKKNGKCKYNSKSLYRLIKKAEKQTSKSKCKDIKEFHRYFAYLKKIAKNANFEKLEEMPCCNNVTRIETLARTALENCEYMLIEDKIASVFEAFNRRSTVNFPEIEEMKNAFMFVYLEKASLLANRLFVIEKIRKIAEKISQKPLRYENSKLYHRVKDNNIFLHFSACEREENIPTADAVYFDVIHSTERILSNIVDGIRLLDAFSFYRFYRPLEIFYTYDVFIDAEECAKTCLLEDFSNQSTNLNIDEYCYAVVLDNYLKRTVPPIFTAKKLNIGAGTIFGFYKKNNLIKIALALTSRDMFSILYSKPKKKSKSILKNIRFKNTFAPYTPQKTLKFGISIASDNLTIKPSVPAEFDKVEIAFSHKGTEHKLTILPSNTEALTVNGTKLSGVPAIKLGKIPLDVELKTPFTG